jgi:hypothetical protein
MPKLNRDGVNIYHEVHGNGPPLILTHGYSSTSAMWQDGAVKTSQTRVAGEDRAEGCIMKSFAAALLMIAGISMPASAQHLAPIGGHASPGFTATLSNNTPLVFGMDTEEAARVLGTPLTYISGRPGEEIFLTFRDIGGSGLFAHKDRLYLQFRKRRLAGWKGDWGHNWMWQ